VRRFLTLFILSTLSYTAVPSRAQERRSTDRARTLERIHDTERQGELSARQWLLEHRLPRRIVQSDGSVIELASVIGDHPIYYVPVNAQSAALMGTVHLQPNGRTGLGLTGAGHRAGVWDSGHARSDHVELAGRVDFGDESETSDHATHVAGTLAAAGIDPQARGMAYEAGITSYTWTSDATEMANEAGSGLLLSNHSYGVLAGWHYGDVEAEGDRWYWMGDPAISTSEDYMFGRYDVTAVQFDRVTYSHPGYLPVVAAGNDRLDAGPRSGSYRALDANGQYQTYRIEDRPIPADGGTSGYDTIAGAGVGKNVLTIGSAGPSDVFGHLRTSAFSSFGPTDDGRIKPDLTGAGENVYSLSSSRPDAYGRSTGTSMATAAVTGSLLLLQQLHYEIYGRGMRAATLKGLALHTARDQDVPGPDYRTGWGVLDAERAALHISAGVENSASMIEAELADGDQFVQDLNVSAPGDVLLTLSWTDPAGVRPPRSGAASLDDDTPQLRNDLDLRLIDRSSGTTYTPYVLDPSDPSRSARPGDNVVDPVEQIYVPEADTGSYAVVVTHKNRLYGEPVQPFSLIVSGAGGDELPVAIGHLQAETTSVGVLVSWRTLFEHRAGTFVVERRSGAAGQTVGEEFMPVAELPVDGTSGRAYAMTDTLSVAGVYRYRITFRDGTDTFQAGSVEVNISAPDSYAILSSYPNPFDEATTLVIDLPRTQHVTLEVFDMMGRRVASGHDGELQAGRHRLTIRGDRWASGVYVARVRTPNGSVSHRIIKQ